MNRNLSDAEIERIVAAAIVAEASAARHEAQPPSSAIVWWRAQMRARQEATRAIERPLTIVHALAIACGAGLLASIVGTVVTGWTGTFGWIGNVSSSLLASGASFASIDFTSRWMMLSMTAMLVSIVVASIAALVIFADE